MSTSGQKRIESTIDTAIDCDEDEGLVEHGREVCTARTKPYCDKCCLADICAQNI